MLCFIFMKFSHLMKNKLSIKCMLRKLHYVLKNWRIYRKTWFKIKERDKMISMRNKHKKHKIKISDYFRGSSKSDF